MLRPSAGVTCLHHVDPETLLFEADDQNVIDVRSGRRSIDREDTEALIACWDLECQASAATTSDDHRDCVDMPGKLSRRCRDVKCLVGLRLLADARLLSH